MLMQITTGEENFPTGGSKCHVFFVPTRQRMGREAHIGQMARGFNPDVPVAQTNQRWFAAMTGYPETLGRWCTANYDVPEGVVLKVFGSKRQMVGRQALPVRTGVVYLQLRSGAAFQRIAFQTLQDSKGALREAMIEGRFDILTPRELGQMGVSMSTQVLSQMSEDAVNRLFNITVLSGATEAKVQVRQSQIKNADGEVVAVQRAVRRRAVDLT